MIKFNKILSEIYFEDFPFEDDYKKEYANLGPEINSDDNMFIPRRTKEEKDKKLLFRTYRIIRDYIKNGSQGGLDLRGSPIEFLPKNLTEVNGNLILNGCKNLKSLPNNLTVNGGLDLGGCTKITSLPSGLKVKNNFSEFILGTLWLTNTNITELPLDLEVGYNIILNRTPIEKLPNNLIVHGSLNLGECKNITSLPTGLKIKYCLDLRNAKITKLPSDLEVEGSILLQSTPLSNLSWNEIKKMIPKVKGDILL